MTVDVVLLQCNQSEMTARSLKSVLAQDWPQVSVVLVDNGSLPEHGAALKAMAGEAAIIELPENIGYVRGTNAGWQRVQGDLVCLLCNDTVLSRSLIRRAVAAFETNSRLAWLSATYQQGNHWISCQREFPPWVLSPLPNDAGPLNEWAESLGDIPELTYWNKTECTCVFCRRSVSDAIGYYDEHLTAGHHDVDYGIRLEQIGHQIGVCQNAVFWHQTGSPTVAVETRAGRAKLPPLSAMNAYLLEKWGKEYEHYWQHGGQPVPPERRER